ncbi:MAG: OmpA family protein [Hyphomicrobium sp.]|jgi:outer membrane protein OmpA-like peptidoglycan-associated protein
MALTASFYLFGTAASFAQQNTLENTVTEPGIPWPVISENEAARLKARTEEPPARDASGQSQAKQAPMTNTATEPGMPWPVISETEADRLKAQTDEPPAHDASGSSASNAPTNTATEPGMPWPVISETEAGSKAPARSVTEPGMPWPVVQDKRETAAAVAPLSAARCEAEIKGAAASGALTFRPAQATLEHESATTLDLIAAAAKRCASVRIVVVGHTDSLGLRSRNLVLSKERAQAVAEYLRKAGVDGHLLVTEGYGAARPVAPNDTPADRAKNRRIEFRVENLGEATQ